MKRISLGIIAALSLHFGCGQAPEKVGFNGSGRSADGGKKGLEDTVYNGDDSKDEGKDKDNGADGDEGNADGPSSDSKDTGKDTAGDTAGGKPDPVTTKPDPIVAKPDGAVNCATFSWETVKKPEDAACFTSPVAAISALPEYVRNFWIMMRDSRSAQTSTLQAPRVIIASPDGSFLIGAASDPNARGDLEVAVYDYEENKWNFAGIDFSTTPPTVEKDLCKTCHGTDVQHPIWTQYGNWTGAFAKGNTLLADESAMLKKFVAGGSDVPELLKVLKYRGASSYDAGRRLAPATQYYGGEENGQVLNYVAMQKAAQSTTARIMKNPEVKLKDVLAMSAEISCNSNSGTMKKFGYSIDKDLSFAIGDAKSRDQFNGRFPASDYLAAELMARALDKDPTLKAKLTQAATAFADPKYEYFKTKSVKEHIAFMAKARTSLRSLMSDYLNRKIGDALRGDQHCSAVQQIISQAE